MARQWPIDEDNSLFSFFSLELEILEVLEFKFLEFGQRTMNKIIFARHSSPN